MTPATPAFRSDINGLRAWAVIAVVCYHFGVPGFGGGFVGVDVFFVISGFLMTDIIVRGLSTGRFSFLAFYMARAKRIIPALLAVCIVLLALGWRFLLPPDYKMLATHSIYSLSFLSNVEFWREAGYFDVASHQKWLLHTWSLSVEWQFYLLLPAILWLVWKIRPGRRSQLIALSAISALSLALCVISTASNPSAAFYLLPMRAWEMLAGGLIAVRGGAALSPRAGRIVQWTGLALIVCAILAFDHHTPWPGWRALLPVGATMLVLLANRASPLTAGSLASWIGIRSYSIYLWHWPLYVTLAYLELQRNPLAIALAIAATLLIGHLSFRWVETPARVSLGHLRTPLAAFAIAAVVGVYAAPALLIWARNGMDHRFSPGAERAAAEANNINPRKLACHANHGVTSPSCTYGSGERHVLVVGDSHADAVIGGVAAAAAPLGVQVIQWTYSGCPVVQGLRKTPAELARLPRDDRCSDFVGWVVAQAKQQPADVPVLLASRYAVAAMGPNETPEDGDTPHVFFSAVSERPDAAFLQEFGDAITSSACAMARQRPVYMLRPIPEIGVDVPRTLSRRIAFGMRGEVSVPLADYRKRNDWVWKAQDKARDQCGVKILDPLPYLCRDGQCFGSIAGRPLYADDNHLSEYGNRLLAPLFSTMLKETAPPPPPVKAGR